MSERVNIGSNSFVYPMPMTLVGAMVEGRANFMAAAWVTRVNRTPPMMGVALNRRHHTPTGIQEQGTFSINIPGMDLLAQTDYCGLVSGREVDKAGVFEVFYGELKTAPMIAQCPLCLECRWVETVPLPTNSFFIGEIVAAYATFECLVDGKPDIGKIKPFVLTMPDNNYWTVGQHAGKAWSIGNEFRPGW